MKCIFLKKICEAVNWKNCNKVFLNNAEKIVNKNNKCCFLVHLDGCPQSTVLGVSQVYKIN